MKLVVLLLLLAQTYPFPGPGQFQSGGGGAITFVNATSQWNGGTTTTSVTLPTATYTTGNIIHISEWFDQPCGGVTMGATGPFTTITGINGTGDPGGNVCMCQMDAVVTSTGTAAVTVTAASGVASQIGFATQYSGQAVSPIDSGVTMVIGDDSSTSLTSSPFNTGFSHEVVTCAMAALGGGTITINSGYTLASGSTTVGSNTGVQYQIFATPQSGITVGFSGVTSGINTMACLGIHP